MSSFTPKVRPGFLAALLLAWFFGQTISVSPELGITADEVIHITAGYSFWHLNDYRLQPENGNLPQRWATLPLLWMAPKWPASAGYSWDNPDSWGAGHRFFFHEGNRPDEMVFAARVMVTLLGVVTGALVYLWAAAVFGANGGLVATAMFAASPTLLAHAGLATSDLAASFGFLAATLSGWRLLHRVSFGRVVVFGGALGALALAKFSAPLFLFIFAAMIAVRVARPAPLIVALGAWRHWSRGWRRLGGLAAATFAAALLAFALIWAAYGFRYSTSADGREVKFMVDWDILLGRTPFSMGTPAPTGLPRLQMVPVEPSFVRTVTSWARRCRVLPEAYLWGFLDVYTYSKWRPAYFFGEYRTSGWLAYFPTTFLTKTPLALLALYLSAALTFARLARVTPRPGRLWYRVAPLLCLLAVYVLFSLTSHLDIGHRHLLPVEVVLCALTGVLGLALPRRPDWRWGLVAGLWLGATFASWQSRPSYLSFFNSLIGGPNQGYKLFVDSSVDWGQGLPRLHDWLDRNRRSDEPVYLAYFGSDSPPYQGVRAVRIGDQYFDREPRSVQLDLTPGLFVVSATLLQGVYTLTPGPWTQDYERAYRSLLQKAHAPDRASQPSDFWVEWDQVRFGRLRSYLRTRPPDAQPDPSLLVFRLDAAELAAALGP